MPHDPVAGRRAAAAIGAAPRPPENPPAATPTPAEVPAAPAADPALDRFTPAARAAFLAALAETGTVREAIRCSGLARATVYRRRARDARFAAAWAEALAIGLDQLRDEAVQRALHGVERPVFHGGKPVGMVRAHSDALLMFLLRAHQPGIYHTPRVARPVAEEEDELAEILRLIDGSTRGVSRDAAATTPGGRDAEG